LFAEPDEASDALWGVADAALEVHWHFKPERGAGSASKYHDEGHL